jgi:hypothetical protein
MLKKESNWAGKVSTWEKFRSGRSWVEKGALSKYSEVFAFNHRRNLLQAFFVEKERQKFVASAISFEICRKNEHFNLVWVFCEFAFTIDRWKSSKLSLKRRCRIDKERGKFSEERRKCGKLLWEIQCRWKELFGSFNLKAFRLAGREKDFSY